jgi:hypothetical protein
LRIRVPGTDEMSGLFQVFRDVERAERDDQVRWLAPASALAAAVLGRALQVADGEINSTALAMVGFTLVLAAAAAVLPRPLRLAHLDRNAVRLIATAGLLAQIVQMLTALPVQDLPANVHSLADFGWSIAALGVAAAWVLWRPERGVTPLQIGALVAVHFAIGAHIIRLVPRPPIDVNVFHHDAIAALRAGISPYAITFPNIYKDAVFYGPGLVVDGRLQFGFPYPPLGLLISIPAELVAGDHRYTNLVAMEAAAVLMAFARPKGFGAFAAALYLTTPRIFYVLDESWTEPLLVVGMAAVVFAACRNNRAASWLLGAFLALKQYLVFVLPATALLVAHLDRRRVWRFFAQALMVASTITLPFFLWSPRAFWHSVVALQFYQPLRLDALSFVSGWVVSGHNPPSPAVAFVAVAIASAVAVWRLPRTPAGFSAAVALIYLAFFAFNKQAFCNYYFFVVGAFCLTLAATSPGSSAER